MVKRRVQCSFIMVELIISGKVSKMAKMKKLRVDEIPAGWKPQVTKVIRAGNVTEFIAMSHHPKKIDSVRISKDCYIKPSEASGEVHEYHHASNKGDSLDSVRRTFIRLRRIINANCTEPANVLMVTLTYEDNMTDSNQLRNDYKNYCGRFKYFCLKNGIAVPEYIAISEPQARGAWHMHCLYIWKTKAPFINNADIEKVWQHGYTHTQAVRSDCDNLGAYFTASATDLTEDEFIRLHSNCADERYITVKSWMDKDGTVTPKRVVKGARLRLYPPDMKIYRASTGIKRPKVEVLTPEEAEQEKASAGTLTFSAAFAVVPDNATDDLDAERLAKSQIISKTYYNKRHKKSQVPTKKQITAHHSIMLILAMARGNKEIADEIGRDRISGFTRAHTGAFCCCP